MAAAEGGGADINLGSGPGPNIDPYINMSSVAGALQNPAGSFWGSSTGSGDGLGYFVTPGAISQGFQGMSSSDLNAFTGLNLASNYDFAMDPSRNFAADDYITVYGQQPGGSSRGLTGSYSIFQNPSFGAFDPGSGIMGIPSGFNPGGFSWIQPEKPEPPLTQWQRIKAAIKNKLENFKDPKKRSDWFKRFFGNLARVNPGTALPMAIYDIVQAIKGGGPGGILGALGQTAMRRMFGPNLDVARGIYGAVSGDMTPGQALGRVALSRGMRAGIQGLMKNIYGQWSMDGVRLAMPMIQTALQGKGKGPGGP